MTAFLSLLLVTGALLLDGRSETIVPLSLAELQAGGLVVHAHKSDAEFEISVACAPIPES